jgi:MarR family transcriptional regulator, lower aerobic nicotinate degradation pathway regulator
MTITATETRQAIPVGALMARLGQEVTARFRKALRPLGLGAQEFIVLKQLQTMGATSQAELADAVGVDYSNLATLAAGFCDRDLIDRSRDPDDRRRYVLELTASGNRLVDRGERAIKDGEDEMLNALDATERDQFYALLRRVADGAELCPPSPSACAE